MKHYSLGTLLFAVFVLSSNFIWNSDALIVFATLFAAVNGMILTLELGQSYWSLILGIIPIMIMTLNGVFAQLGIFLGTSTVYLQFLFIVIFLVFLVFRTLKRFK